MKYQINKNLIPNLPETPYDQGIGAYLGCIAHSTGNDDASDLAIDERAFEVDTWKNAFVHFFVDWTQILQVANTNYIAYGAGHTGNHAGYVHVELCQTKDPNKFLASYDRYVWLLAYILFQKKLTVIDGLTLRSHANISNTYHESDHQDPLDYLQSHGATWGNVVRDVTRYYKEMEGFGSMYKDDDKIGEYAKEAVKFVTEKGIMKGDTEGNFKPLEAVTRQDLAVVIYNQSKIKNQSI